MHDEKIVENAELIGTVTYRDTTWLMVGYSPDVFATSGSGVYAQLGARVPLNDTVLLEGAVDLLNIEGDVLGLVEQLLCPLHGLLEHRSLRLRSWPRSGR